MDTYEVSNRRKRVLVTAFNAHEAREIAMLAWNLHSVRDTRAVRVRLIETKNYHHYHEQKNES